MRSRRPSGLTVVLQREQCKYMVYLNTAEAVFGAQHMSTDTNPGVEALTTGERKTDDKRVRVFISSPSDVWPERLMAQRLVERLAREFSTHFRVEPVLWEREPLVATEHFQTSITPPHATDIAVVILWSRLGVLLPVGQFPGAITGRQVTGTEWEFEDAFASYQKHG